MNGIKILNYIDKDQKASKNGFIGLQIHNKTVMKVEYKNICAKLAETLKAIS